MNRSASLLLLSLLAFSTLCACASRQPRDIRVYVPEPPHASKAHKLPPQCASGCAVVPDAVRKVLDDDALDALLVTYADSPAGEDSDALSELLFYASQTRARLAEDDRPTLPGDHEAVLRRELARTTARIELRVIDEHGQVRAWMDATRVPLGEKQHIHLDNKNLPGVTASGTVLRTSLYHLWTRI
jgi:hypothetical protein